MRNMPLDLDARSLDRFSDRALHRQLADLIRAQIKSGAVAVGEALPSEGALAWILGASRTVVRDGLDALVAEGLLVKRAGAATRVAAPPAARHVSTARYAEELALLRKLDGAPHPLMSAFTQDHAAKWENHRVEAVSYAEDVATAEDAARLDVAEDSPVLRRQLIKYVADQAVQLQESTIPLSLVEGTPVTDPERQPWPGGTIAELFSVGLTVTRVVEEARARTPTTAERRQLEMQAAGPVLVVVRTFFADVDDVERPVEVSTVTVPAARLILRFETDLRA